MNPLLYCTVMVKEAESASSRTDRAKKREPLGGPQALRAPRNHTLTVFDRVWRGAFRAILLKGSRKMSSSVGERARVGAAPWAMARILLESSYCIHELCIPTYFGNI